MYPPQPAAPDLLSYELNSTSSITWAMNNPYRVHHGLDLVGIGHLVTGQLDDVKDHVWALREKPSYFAEVVHDYLKPGEVATAKALGAMVGQAYFTFVMWDNLHEHILALQKLSEQYPEGLDMRDDECLDAVLTLERIPEWIRTCMCNMLGHALLDSREFRRFGKVTSLANPEASFLKSIAKERLPKDLWHKMQYLSTHDCMCGNYLTGFKVLEKFIKNDKTARKWISPRTERILTQNSILAECSRQILELGPFKTQLSASMGERKNRVGSLHLRPVYEWVAFVGHEMKLAASARLGDPTDGKFRYPCDRPRNQSNVVTMCRAENNLDKFWKSVDAQLQTKVRPAHRDALERLVNRIGVLQRTPEWVDTESPSTKRPEQPISEYQPLPGILHDVSKDITGRFDKLAIPDKNIKEQTRRSPQPENLVSPHLAEPEIINLPIFYVTNTTYYVFKALFFMKDDKSQGSIQVKWTDFLKALGEAGLSMQSLKGSAWEFRMQESGIWKRSIQFHEPHPDGELAVWKARMYGRRLSRAYGWHGEMFRLR